MKWCAPQSNQRGIETRMWQKIFGPSWRGLNRTSVGLKPRGSAPIPGRGIRLNRTSVGLKHVPFRPHPARESRLNRTSVGLKLRSRCGRRRGAAWPQSNQRGIETH